MSERRFDFAVGRTNPETFPVERVQAGRPSRHRERIRGAHRVPRQARPSRIARGDGAARIGPGRRRSGRGFARAHERFDAGRHLGGGSVDAAGRRGDLRGAHLRRHHFRLPNAWHRHGGPAGGRRRNARRSAGSETRRTRRRAQAQVHLRADDLPESNGREPIACASPHTGRSRPSARHSHRRRQLLRRRPLRRRQAAIPLRAFRLRQDRLLVLALEDPRAGLAPRLPDRATGDARDDPRPPPRCRPQRLGRRRGRRTLQGRRVEPHRGAERIP